MVTNFILSGSKKLDLNGSKKADFSDLVGKIIENIIVMQGNDVSYEHIIFETSVGLKYIMHHKQDCCEQVIIDYIDGDLKDIMHTPIVKAYESTNEIPSKSPNEDCRELWTFYNMATIKGHVQIKWIGSSNGYYSEEVNFDLLTCLAAYVDESA